MPTQIQLDQLALMVPWAQASQARWKVPASVTLAQWVLESAWGTSQLARRANNFFGVKAVQGEAYAEFTTREVVSGRSVEELAHFAFFKSAAESFDMHGRLLASLPRYAAAFRAGSVAGFCHGLVAGGYSTEPTYAERLLLLIDQLNLTHYDAPAAAGPGASSGKQV